MGMFRRAGWAHKWDGGSSFLCILAAVVFNVDDDSLV